MRRAALLASLALAVAPSSASADSISATLGFGTGAPHTTAITLVPSATGTLRVGLSYSDVAFPDAAFRVALVGPHSARTLFDTGRAPHCQGAAGTIHCAAIAAVTGDATYTLRITKTGEHAARARLSARWP